jgi:SAM-dependent methyltransferase
MADEAENIIGIYRRYARKWAHARGGALLEQAWIDRFLELVPQGGHVLDIGCGPGEPIARYVSMKGFKVTGLDSSPEMVSMFAANVPGATALVGDMRTMHLRTKFDGLIAWDSFFHLTHEGQRAMFAIFSEHARPGSPLMFTSGPAHGEAIGILEKERLYHASLSRDEYSALLDETGFELVKHVAQDASCGGRTIWLARRRQKAAGVRFDQSQAGVGLRES